MWFAGTDEYRRPKRKRRSRGINREDLIEEIELGADGEIETKPSKTIEDYYDEQGLKDNIQTIKDIGSNKLGSKIKGSWEGNLKGALYGGGVGVLLAIATRQSPYIFGIVGLVVGRMLFSKKKK